MGLMADGSMGLPKSPKGKWAKNKNETQALLKFEKEKMNDYDSGAIAVKMPYIDTVGYVANSPNTTFKGTYSAGRLYDSVGDFCYARVMFVTHSSVIALILTEQANYVCEKMFSENEEDVLHF